MRSKNLQEDGSKVRKSKVRRAENTGTNMDTLNILLRSTHWEISQTLLKYFQGTVSFPLFYHYQTAPNHYPCLCRIFHFSCLLTTLSNSIPSSPTPSAYSLHIPVKDNLWKQSQIMPFSAQTKIESQKWPIRSFVAPYQILPLSSFCLLYFVS